VREMKYAKWKYKFMHSRLTERGYKPVGIHFKRIEIAFYVGLYSKGNDVIHIEYMIKEYQKFVNNCLRRNHD